MATSDIGKFSHVGSIPDGSQGDDIHPGSPTILSGPYQGQSFWHNTIHSPLTDCDDGASALESAYNQST